MSPLGAALLAPVWGMLADRYGAHRLILRGAAVLAALLALLLMTQNQYVNVLVVVGLLAIFVAPIAPVMDSYGVTRSERYRIPYGQFRVWGAGGYIATSWLVGQWMGRSVAGVFLIGYAVSYFLLCFSSLGFKPLRAEVGGRMHGALRSIISNPGVILLLVTAYLFSSAAGIMYNYLSIYLSELGGSDQLIGAAFSLNALSELPVMFFSGWIFSRFGARRMLAIAIGLYTIRLLGYSFLPSAEWVLPFQLLHGLTYGVFLMASLTLMHRMAGREHAATAQGVLSSVSVGFGMITGALLGGALLDKIGTSNLFWVAACVMFSALAVYIGGMRALRADSSPAR